MLKGEVKITAQLHCGFILELSNESAMRGVYMMYVSVM